MLSAWIHERKNSTGLEDFYFEFSELGEAISRSIESGSHILLYGHPRQGKTTVFRRALTNRRSITLHASEDFGFSDMARNILLSLGCSVVTEQKKKRRASGKAEVKFSWPFISPTVSAEGGLESELTLRTFTADIGNPNDVCHLLTQLGEVPLVVIEHFERLKRKDRRLIVEFLQIAAENKAVQIALIASSLEIPLKYRERIELSRVLSIVHLPLMTKGTTARFMQAALKHLKCPVHPEVADLTYERFEGGMEMTIEVCALVASKYRTSDPRSAEATITLDDYLNSEFQQRSKTYFLAFLSSIIETGWEFRCSKRNEALPFNSISIDSLEVETSDEDEDYDEIAPISDILNSDRVFRNLHSVASEATTKLGPRHKLAPVYEAVTLVARKLLRSDVQSEASRLLAFAMDQFLRRPLAQENPAYMPARENEVIGINCGVVVCDMLLKSNLSNPVILTSEILIERLESYGFILRADGRQAPWGKFCKRIRRLQKDLLIEPELFKINSAKSEIVLWQPERLSFYGDIRPDLESLLDEEDESYFLEKVAAFESPLSQNP